MNLFRRKFDKDPAGRNQPAVTRRLTRDLARAETLAHMLANSRAANSVEVADLLTGIYIYDWERISRFWDARGEIETFLQRICLISPQRWHHWIEFYDQQRRDDDKKNARRLFATPKNEGAPAKQLILSSELEAVLKKAEGIAPHHDSLDGRPIPILTSECVLLAIAQNSHSEISRKLLDTGLDVAALEQAARNPRHAPLH